ncbi:MAG: SEL1-like repeat protein [Alphaproteobacteria bacterium]|nr:SEL1-like repeat protein [Alphaproteobacteria bacterium]MBV9693396.1 SEL1-like repeat protein [Alphaproteobacteria bacterium]
MSLRTDIFKSPGKPHWVSQRERAAARDALVDVARSLVSKEGEAALSLGKVADAAGLARATVYGYFSGKSELLRAITAHGVFLPGHEPPATAAEVEPAGGPASPEPKMGDDDEDEWLVFEGTDAAGETPEQPVEAAPEQPAAEPAADDAPAPGDSGTSIATAAEAEPQAPADEAAEERQTEPPAIEAPLRAHTVDVEPPIQEPVSQEPEPQAAAFAPDQEQRTLQATHLEEIARRLILPESALKEGTDAVIARLDMRVRVLEKSVAALETRSNAQDAELPRRLRPLSEQIEQLAARADSGERRHLETAAELRLAVHSLETRLNALAPAPQEPAQAFDPAAFSIEVEAAEEAVPNEPESRAAEDALSEEAKPHYLAAVRNLANEGARQAAQRENEIAEERRMRRRRMIVAGGIAATCLVVLGALVAFRPGAHGVSVARSFPNPAFKHAPVLAPLDRLTQLADRGNADAELLVGLKYLSRTGQEASALRWLARAAEAGNAVALNALGTLYQQGRGVKADSAMAARLYLAAAAKGNRHAMSNLAILYAGGDARLKDLPEAARWFERSASLGYVDAQFNLAVLYERGDGVAQSLIDAYKWYAIAAAAGDAVSKARAGAIATQLTPEELSAAEKAASEFRAARPDPASNDVPAIAELLAAK